jgi:hypothetical protein
MNEFHTILKNILTPQAARIKIPRLPKLPVAAIRLPKSLKGFPFVKALQQRTKPGPLKVEGEALVVSREEKPLWQERGWKKSGNHYRGYYRTPYGSRRGRITEGWAGQKDVFIKDPPEQLKDHACFHLRTEGWYSIHFHQSSEEVGAYIIRVEALLAGAFTRHALKPT